MSCGKLNLNYLEHPIGMAVCCLKGDLMKAENKRELMLIRSHWAFAVRYFRVKARRLGKRSIGKTGMQITELATKEELYLTLLKTAKNSLANYGVALK